LESAITARLRKGRAKGKRLDMISTISPIISQGGKRCEDAHNARQMGDAVRAGAMRSKGQVEMVCAVIG
jgi:hypothetical protein